jgi:hypothetical protein
LPLSSNASATTVLPPRERDEFPFRRRHLVGEHDTASDRHGELRRSRTRGDEIGVLG